MVTVSKDNIFEFIAQMERTDFLFERKRGIIKIDGLELLRDLSIQMKKQDLKYS